MIGFLMWMYIGLAALSGQAPQASELVLEKILDEAYVETFAFVEGSSFWASSGYYGVTLWEGNEKITTIESRWNPSAMQFGEDPNTLWFGTSKLDIETESLTQMPKLWDTSFRATINSMVYAEDGKHIVVYAVVRPMKTLDRTPDPYIGAKLLVIDTETGKATRTLVENASFLTNTVAMAREGDLLVVAADKLQAWNWQTGELLYGEDITRRWLQAVDFDPSSSSFIVGDNYGMLEYWDSQNWTQQSSFKTGLSRIMHLQYHPYQPLLAVTGEEGEILLYQVEGSQVELASSLEVGSPITSLGWGGNGEKLYVSTREQILIYALK